MQVTVKTILALRVLQELEAARAYTAPKALTTDDLARRIDVSRAYIEQAMRAIKRAGLVCALRGNVNGGYYLTGQRVDLATLLADAEGILEPDSDDAPDMEHIRAALRELVLAGLRGHGLKDLKR